MELHSPLYFLSPVIDIKRHDACVATICERITAVSAKVPARVTPLPSCIVVSLEIHQVTAPIPNALNAFPAQIEGPPPECIGIVFLQSLMNSIFCYRFSLFTENKKAPQGMVVRFCLL